MQEFDLNEVTNEDALQEAKLTQEKIEEQDVSSIDEMKDEIQRLNVDTQSILKNIEKSIQDFAYKDKINKELHEELQKYKSGLRMEFVMPLLKSIIREYDRSTQQYQFYLQKSEEEPQSELFVKLLKEFKMISLSLLDVLDDYNFEPFVVEAGVKYSSREHKIMKVIETEDNEKDSTVEKCVICGFRDSESGRLIRQAEVNIYNVKK